MSNDIAARMASQNAEFDAVQELAKQMRRIELTPVVDDDYPSVRFDYERAVKNVLEACAANGRSLPSAVQRGEPVAWMLPEGPDNQTGRPQFFVKERVVEMMREGGYDNLVPLYQSPASTVAATAAYPLTRGLLVSIALRLDHGLLMPLINESDEEHQRRIEAAISDAQRVYEEITGKGFYCLEREESYKQMEEHGISPACLMGIARPERHTPAPQLESIVPPCKNCGSPDHVNCGIDATDRGSDSE